MSTPDSDPTDPTRHTMIKGASILARLEYVRSDLGTETLDRVMKALDAADRKLLDARILPSTPYPLALNGRLDEAIARVVDPQHPAAVYRQLGRASAERNLRGVHRIFISGEGPNDVLRRYPSVRRTYYSDGDASFEPIGEHEGILSVVGAVSHTSADCESTAGYFQRAMELLGGKDPSVVVRCIKEKGKSLCTFTCRWRAPSNT